MAGSSLEPGYFDRLYASDPDPWRFETSYYERAKYAATVAALPRKRYRRGVEAGCSIGVLTAQLAARCDRMLGIDVAAAALDRARQRLAGVTNVEFSQLRLPSERPPGRFDLIALSEILYYFDIATLASLAEVVIDMAAPDADILMVHWLGPTPDYPLTGDTAVAAFLAALAPRVAITLQTRTPDYRLDRLRRV